MGRILIGEWRHMQSLGEGPVVSGIDWSRGEERRLARRECGVYPCAAMIPIVLTLKSCLEEIGPFGSCYRAESAR